MLPIIRFLFVFLTLLCGMDCFTPRLTEAASFDCRKASTPVEKAICADQELSRLDDLLVASYKESLRVSSNPEKLKVRQRSWLQNERNVCRDIECIRAAYATRIGELNELAKLNSLPQSSPSPSEGKPIKTYAATKSGKVELIAEVGMWWYHIILANGKRMMIGAAGALPYEAIECLDRAMDHDDKVEISGMVEVWKDKSESFQEDSVTCKNR